MKKQFLLSLMAMLLPLAVWAGSKTETGSYFVVTLNESEFTYDGGKDSKPTITVTGLNGGSVEGLYKITYLKNGSEISQTEIRDAGTYTVKVEKDGAIAGLEVEPTTIDFTITPKPLTKVSFTGMTKVYGATDDEIDYGQATIDGLVENTQTEIDNAIKCLKLEAVENHNGTNVGEELWVIVNGKSKEDNTESNYSYTATGSQTTYDVDILPRPLTVTFDEGKNRSTYDANEVLLTTLLGQTYIKIGNIYKGENVTIDLSIADEGVEKLQNAKEYTLNVALVESNSVNKNYEIATESKTIKYTIDPAELTIKQNGQAPITITYGDEAALILTDKFDFEFAENESEDVTSKFAMKAKLTEDKVGTYSILPYYGDGFVEDYENGIPNYTIIYDQTVEVTVDAASISTADITLANTIYQAAKFDPTKKITVTEGDKDTEKTIITVNLDGKELTLGKDYNVEVEGTDGKNATNAGEEFKVVVTGQGNYKDKKEYTGQTIKRAMLNIEAIEGEEFTGVYSGQNVGNLTSKFNITGFVTETETASSIGLTLQVKKKDVKDGGHVVHVYNGYSQVERTDYPEAFDNYGLVYNTRPNYVITPKPATYWIEGETVPYNAKAQTAKGEMKIDGLVEGETLTEAVFAFVEEGEVKNVKEGGYALEITNIDEIIAAAKNYDLTASEEKEDTPFTIIPAEVTFKVGDKGIDFGTTKEEVEALLKTWAKYSSTDNVVTMTGAQSGDGSNLRNLFKLNLSEDAWSLKSGKYGDGENKENGGIIVELYTRDQLKEADRITFDNYKTDWIPGILTIGGKDALVLNVDNVDDPEEEEQENEELWSVAKTIEKYNGATVNTVTIENLKNNFSGQLAADGKYDFYTDHKLEAEKWYTLVLPFDVEVADLSYQLGYAIVNVPNPDATPTTDKIYYKLTMGLVPANTLMLFKVAKDTDCKGKKLVFKEVTISAPGEGYEWATDQAGHEYRGVYTYTELTEAHEYIYNSGQGGVTKASTILEKKGHNAEAYPLSGYFIIDAPETANVRIFVEEIDGTVTALDAVTGEAIGTSAEGWYTVGGMKLDAQPTQKGIYINNGKKVVIK